MVLVGLRLQLKVAQLSSVSGTIFVGAASTNFNVSGFITSGLVASITTQSSDSINTNVTVTPASDTSATVAVPAAVYNNVTAGNVVQIKVTNSDDMTSGIVNSTAAALPTGGTISISGSTRTQYLHQVANFVVPTGFSGAGILLVAGGGSGGGRHGGGGGGGYLEGTKTITAGTYAIVIGGGADIRQVLMLEAQTAAIQLVSAQQP